MNKSITKNTRAFDSETIKLIKETIAVGATDNELQMFLYQAQKTGLDPIARQIYFIKRKVWNKDKGGYEEKANISASIDGLRLVAQKSGEYAGQDEPIFVDESPAGIPKVAKVTVYKFSPNGTRYPAAVGVAYWSEYCPKEGQNFMWLKMPHTMLAKVAESLALRKAFPQELSGIYSQEEMDQANTEVVTTIENEQTKEINPPLETASGDEVSDKTEPDETELSKCEHCHKPLTIAVLNYSSAKFGHGLCMDCQKLAKDNPEWITSGEFLK